VRCCGQGSVNRRKRRRRRRFRGARPRSCAGLLRSGRECRLGRRRLGRRRCCMLNRHRGGRRGSWRSNRRRSDPRALRRRRVSGLDRRSGHRPRRSLCDGGLGRKRRERSTRRGSRCCWGHGLRDRGREQRCLWRAGCDRGARHGRARCDRGWFRRHHSETHGWRLLGLSSDGRCRQGTGGGASRGGPCRNRCLRRADRHRR
jgi:hypothetical protein